MIKTNLTASGYCELTQEFKGANHPGIDIVGKGYTVDYVNSVDKGFVCEVGYGNTVGVDTRGRFVRINHENGFITEYCHLSEVYVSLGEHVESAERIGLMGKTGPGVTGVHLDFKVIEGANYNNYINPMPFIEGFPKPVVEVPTTTNDTVVTVDILDLVRRTIRGDFGNGQDRINNLGVHYDEVQNQVNLNYANGTTNWDNIRFY